MRQLEDLAEQRDVALPELEDAAGLDVAVEESLRHQGPGVDLSDLALVLEIRIEGHSYSSEVQSLELNKNLLWEIWVKSLRPKITPVEGISAPTALIDELFFNVMLFLDCLHIFIE